MTQAVAVKQENSAIQDFLVHLEKERDVSKHTLKAYARDLDAFVDYLGSYYGANAWSWQGLDRLTIRGFLGYLTKKKLSKRSMARALSTVRSFYRYLHRNELVDANPARAKADSPTCETRRSSSFSTRPECVCRSSAESTAAIWIFSRSR